MSVLQELLTAIQNEITAEYSGPTLENYGFGLSPITSSRPVLGWDVVTAVENYYLSPGADYLTTYQIQFTASSSSESALESIQIIEEVKTIFRSSSLTLPTNRCYNIDIGTTVTTEMVPRADGWVTFVTIFFECTA